MLSRRPVTQAIDLDDLLDLVGGDLDLLREVADLGASDVARLIDGIDRAPTAAAIATFAHELKGVLLNLTAAPAAQRAAAVERAARAGDEQEARAELARGRQRIESVVATLASVAGESLRAAS